MTYVTPSSRKLLLASHDGDFLPQMEQLLDGERQVGVVGFKEFLNAGFADLPIPANSQLVAQVSGGEEVILYTYQPEQNGWLRLAGPKWRALLDNLPGVSPDREYVPCTTTGSPPARSVI